MSSRPRPSFSDHLRIRLPVALAAVALGLAARLATPSPPARTEDAIAGMLGEAIGGVVDPGDFIWEARGGFLHDALLGRRVLFLGAPSVEGAAPGAKGAAPSAEGAPSARGPADLYRAQVRLTRSGRPVSLRSVHNLTATPLGDDRELVARGRFVAFTTTAFGAVQGITLLDLGGAGALPARLGDRLRAAVDGWLESGSARGAARTEISFDTPPSAARLDLDGERLIMALGPDALPAALDAATGELDTGGKDPFGARVHRVPRRDRPLSELAALSAGRLLGPEAGAAIARLAQGARRLSSLLGAEPDVAPASPGAPPPPEPVPPGLPSLWPLPRVSPVIDPPLPGEGEWVTAAPASGRAAGGAAGGGEAPQRPGAGPLLATFLRPDPERPRLRVHLLAIDTRHVALHLQAGFDAPRPMAGPRGTGKIPERMTPQILGAIGVDARSAAPFALAGGGTEALGMVVEGRTLAPPRGGAATLVVDREGRPHFGVWPSGEEPQRAAWSLWQSPTLLEGGGAAGALATSGNDGASRNGDGALAPGDDDDELVERAGLCMTERGFVIHAWGSALDAAALRAALARAGCVTGMSLGKAPAPLGFAFLSALDDGRLRAEPLLPAMSLAPEPLTSASPDAFLYLVARGWDQAMAPGWLLPSGVSWAVDDAAQPHPAWIPAVYTAEAVHLGARVRLLAIAPDRFHFRLRAGAREISPRNAPQLAGALSPDERQRALVAIGLGTGRQRRPRGLAIEGTVGLRFRGAGGLLVIRGGRVEIHPAGGLELTPDMDATELPLTAEDATLQPDARVLGSMRRRSAACVLESGTLLVATTTFDSHEATTEALLDLGCSRVVALDRGRHEDAFVLRASGDAPLRQRYDETTLFAVGVAMPGLARRLSSERR